MKKLQKASISATTALVCSLIAIVTMTTAPSAAPNDISQCRAIGDPAARLQCYERLAPPDVQLPPLFNAPSAPANSSQMPQLGNWRLLRTPNPKGGKEAISIIRTGDLAGSDPDFVGLMIRCGEPDVEILLVMLNPLPFRARPKVSLNDAKFEGSVAPPGLNILLPREATDLAILRWPTIPHLSIEISEEGKMTKGKVFLDGFDVAIKALNAACLLRQ
jgi:hypothetical protein